MIPFSIILINKDDAFHLDICLQSLSFINYPKELFEVIIVDDGSNPSLESQLSFVPDYSYRFHYVPRDQHSCRSRARNIGTSLANHEYLIFFDGDQAVTSDVFLTYSNYIAQNPKMGLVFGTRIDLQPWQRDKCIESLQDKSFPGVIKLFRGVTDAKMQLLKSLGKNFVELPLKWDLFWSCNFCVRKAVYIDLTGFDESFKKWGLEDTEFAYRLLQNNYQLDFIENKVLNFSLSHQLTPEKYLGWLTNFQLFYQKYQDPKILLYFSFEDISFKTAMNQLSPVGWFDIYQSFYEKIDFYTDSQKRT